MPQGLKPPSPLTVEPDPEGSGYLGTWSVDFADANEMRGLRCAQNDRHCAKVEESGRRSVDVPP